jgi:hypothetical protein
MHLKAQEMLNNDLHAAKSINNLSKNKNEIK